ncbi:MAG TPA: glycosyltransferase family 4 protein [bacterium]
MKVLFVHNWFHIESGSGTCMFQEAGALRAAGHEVEFFCTDKRPHWDAGYGRTGLFPRFVDPAALGWGGRIRHAARPFHNREAVRAMERMLAAARPDVVHEHTTSFHLTPAVLGPCRRRGVPIVMTIHGAGLFCPAHSLVRGDGRRCATEPCIRGNALPALVHGCLPGPRWHRAATALVHSWYHAAGYYRSPAAFVVASRAMRELALRAGIDERRLAVVPYGLDASQPGAPAPARPREGFVYAGRLVREKGVHHLLRAAALLERPPRLLIAGAGPEEGRLRELAAALGLPHAEFLGWRSRRELAELYRGAIASVLPCDWFEAVGMSILEGFAQGTPAIASRIGGVPEFVEDGVDGLLVEPGDVRQLAAALARLEADPGLAVRLGVRGRERALRDHRPDVHADRVLQVYAAAIDGGVALPSSPC